MNNFTTYLFFLLINSFFLIIKDSKLKYLFLLSSLVIFNIISYKCLKIALILSAIILFFCSLKMKKLKYVSSAILLSIILSFISYYIGNFIVFLKKIESTKIAFTLIDLFIICPSGILYKKYQGKLMSLNLILPIFLDMFFIFIYFYSIRSRCNSPLFIAEYSFKNDIFAIFFICIFSIPFIIIGNILGYNIENKKIKNKENKLISTYYKDLDKTNQKLRKNQHDIKNIFLSLSGLIEKDDISSLKKYFRENFKAYYDKILVDEDYISELSKINLPLLRGLIYEKISLAKSLNLDILLRIPVRIEEVKIDELDLVKLLGILLDNAIEEVKTHSNSYIIIDILKTNKATTFAVENSITKEKVDVENLLSTKGENRGFGLLNLREIINSYDNIDFKTYSKDFKFVQIISIR